MRLSINVWGEETSLSISLDYIKWVEDVVDFNTVHVFLPGFVFIQARAVQFFFSLSF